jgi:1,4-alpha-glucan branching enzyme
MPATAPDLIAAIVGGYHGAPFDVLGLHPGPEGAGLVLRTFQPEAKEVAVQRGQTAMPMERVHEEGFFELALPDETRFFEYQLAVTDWSGNTQVVEDPYRFAPVLGEMDLYLYNEGNLLKAWEKLGAHPITHQRVAGTVFAVWAPGALRVSVVGDFNRWDGRRHPMRPRGGSGIWELFIPTIGPGTVYKYEVKSRFRGYMANKADPYGFATELRPANASVVFDLNRYQWNDGEWMATRKQAHRLAAPINIYEVHLGSWKRKDDNKWLTYRELADDLVPYARAMGYTHLETMPIAEHPYDGSWGYQVTGYFAPTSRFGSPDDFRYFVDKAHQAGLGVVVDWVPAHFPKDEHGLGYFDGTHLYEHADPRQGEHRDWGTFIFNFGRSEVRNFLLSNALFWLENYHIDGLRVDAVASMLYLDYSRRSGEWVPNKFGGRENLEAVDFLKRFNDLVHEHHPDVLTFAEESTSWPMVSRPVYLGGLGFDFKWNMGWMHDMLEYFQKDPVHRRYHHNNLTFAMMYAYTENFILAFSHDEVVYGKRSLLNKMPGDEWRQFANLRALYAYMTAFPGKKLNFMGGEFAQWNEWNFQAGLDWYLLDKPFHRQMQAFVRDLNHVYIAQASLHEVDFQWDGFQWVDFRDVDQSIVSFIRYAEDKRECMVVVANFTPVPRTGYRVGAPVGGRYSEILNSDSAHYGGSNMGNAGGLPSEPTPWQGQPHSLLLTVPPLAVVYLKAEKRPEGDGKEGNEGK